MRHRALAALVAAALALILALPVTAHALTVHLRVEGPKGTIFGSDAPLVSPFVGALPAGEAKLQLDQPTVLGALAGASDDAGFPLVVADSSFGPYVTTIGTRTAEGSSGWVFKVNGVLGAVGADQYAVEEGDEVLWYFATFSKAGGPPTLDLARTRTGCYRAVSVDDAGARSRAANVVFRLDGRALRSASGTLCPSGDWETLRVTKRGAIRSELLRRG